MLSSCTSNYAKESDKREKKFEGKGWSYGLVQTTARNFRERKVYKKKKVYVTNQEKVLRFLKILTFDIRNYMKLFTMLKNLWAKIREVDSIIRQINR